MSRFLAGFLSASLLWAGAAFAYVQGYLPADLFTEHPEEVTGEIDAEEPAPDSAPRKKRMKRANRRRRSPARRGDHGSAIALEGDDLGGPGIRTLQADQAGGEEQLRGDEIERGFDSVMPRIRRCLMLVADDAPMTGKLVFGIRIHGTSGVTKVNLQGPSAISRGEAGSCLRDAVRNIRFRSFDGPDMLVQFPLTLQ